MKKMFEALKKEIVKEISSEVMEKKPNSDDELRELAGEVIERRMKK